MPKLLVERRLVEDVVLLERLLVVVGVAASDVQAVRNAHAALTSMEGNFFFFVTDAAAEIGV